MACPAPGAPLSGSMQRNKMFGAVGGGGGGQPSFMSHGGNVGGGGSSIAATYMQNKLRNSQQRPTMNHQFGMVGSKSAQQNPDMMMGNEDGSVHQVHFHNKKSGDHYLEF